MTVEQAEKTIQSHTKDYGEEEIPYGSTVGKVLAEDLSTSVLKQSYINHACAETHSSPSSKTSFFHIGTVFFNVLIEYRQASNAALR